MTALIAPHYSPSVRWGDLLFVSGQLPLVHGSTTPSGDFGAQTRQALSNLFDVLRSAGSGPGDVLKVTAFITGIEHWAEFNRVYAEMFGEHRPARSVVPVQPLHFGCLIEIEAIAAAR